MDRRCTSPSGPRATSGFRHRQQEPAYLATITVYCSTVRLNFRSRRPCFPRRRSSIGVARYRACWQSRHRDACPRASLPRLNADQGLYVRHAGHSRPSSSIRCRGMTFTYFGFRCSGGRARARLRSVARRLARSLFRQPHDRVAPDVNEDNWIVFSFPQSQTTSCRRTLKSDPLGYSEL